jgi:hypothetical protein
MVRVVNIKGPTGSGKSTIVKQMIDDDTYFLLDGKQKPYTTVFPNIKWAAVGPYKADGAPTSNGCDSVGKVDLIKEYIGNILDELPGYDVVFEGAMISTIISTYYQYLLYLQERDKVRPGFVLLQTSPDKCLERMAGRGSLRPGIDMDRLIARCDSVVNNAIKHYDPKYIRILKVDEVEQPDMLKTFLQLVGDL